MNLFNPKSGLLALIQVRTYFWPSDTECKESRDSSRKKKLLSKRYRIDIIHLSNLRAKYCFYKICTLRGAINEFRGFDASLFKVDINFSNSIWVLFNRDTRRSGPTNCFAGFQRFTQIFTRNTRKLDVWQKIMKESL